MKQGHQYLAYSGASTARVKVLAVIAFVSVIISLLARHGIHLLDLSASSMPDSKTFAFFFVAAAPITVFGALIYLFNSYLWRTAVGRWLISFCGDKAPPQIQGTYEGKVTWYDREATCSAEKSGVSNACVRIIQSWTSIGILFDFTDKDGSTRANSHSDMASMMLSMDPNEVTLEYTYRYEGVKPRANGEGVTKQIIQGTSLLTFQRKIEPKWNVRGTYYSDDGGSGVIRLSPTAVEQ